MSEYRSRESLNFLATEGSVSHTYDSAGAKFYTFLKQINSALSGHLLEGTAGIIEENLKHILDYEKFGQELQHILSNIEESIHEEKEPFAWISYAANLLRKCEDMCLKNFPDDVKSRKKLTKIIAPYYGKIFKRLEDLLLPEQTLYKKTRDGKKLKLIDKKNDEDKLPLIQGGTTISTLMMAVPESKHDINRSVEGVLAICMYSRIPEVAQIVAGSTLDINKLILLMEYPGDFETLTSNGIGEVRKAGRHQAYAYYKQHHGQDKTWADFESWIKEQE